MNAICRDYKQVNASSTCKSGIQVLGQCRHYIVVVSIGTFNHESEVVKHGPLFTMHPLRGSASARSVSAAVYNCQQLRYHLASLFLPSILFLRDLPVTRAGVSICASWLALAPPATDRRASPGLSGHLAASRSIFLAARSASPGVPETGMVVQPPSEHGQYSLPQ